MRLALPLVSVLLLLHGPERGGQKKGSGTTTLLAAAAPAPHAFPWLWSGIPGLSPACDQGASLSVTLPPVMMFGHDTT